MKTLNDIKKEWDRTLETEDIEEFINLLKQSANSRIKNLQEDRLKQSPSDFDDMGDYESYGEHLEQLMILAEQSRMLGDELAIVALYKRIETHTKEIVKKKVPAAAGKSLSSIDDFIKVIPFDIKTVAGYDSFNELRLINNSIKHNEVVSAQLAKEYPTWTAGDSLENLDAAFKRLLPGAKQYVFDLIGRVY